MDVVIAKVVSIIILFILTTLSGLLPILLVNKLRAQRTSKDDTIELEKEVNTKHGLLLSCLMCFGGGVLLATCLVHMLPEVREMFDKGFANQGENAPKFPVIETVLCLGFFFVYFIEEMISFILGHRSHSHFNSSAHDHSPVVVHCDSDNPESVRTDQSLVGSSEGASLVRSADDTPTYGTEPQNNPSTKSNQPPSGIKGLMIVVALSFHAIFEGMSIGLQPDAVSVWALFFGISIHKLVLAFCVGLETYLHGTSQTLVIIYMIVFASMTPVGGGIGSVLDAALSKSLSVLAILQAIAAGTIMYVTFFEVFFQEKRNQQPGLLKLSAALIGFSVMASLSLLE